MAIATEVFVQFIKDLIINLIYVQLGNVSSGAAAAPPVSGGGQTGAASGTMAHQQPQGGMMTTLIFFGVMILIFYLLIFRPQQKRAKKHQSFLASLRPGDRVITSTGIYGTVTSLTENIAELEIAKNVKIKILKNQIATFQASHKEGGARKDMENIERGVK